MVETGTAKCTRSTRCALRRLRSQHAFEVSIMSDSDSPPDPADRSLRLAMPSVDDGAALWRIARDSHVLDVNSPYAYLLWCRDFAATSAVARLGTGGRVVGFVTGYVRPDDPSVLMVWQVAVDAAARGHGVAGALLDRIFAEAHRRAPSIAFLETTITDDNPASHRLFEAFATRHGTELSRSALFEAKHFPGDSGDDHAAELLHRIGPIAWGP
ncbi:MAG TPA: diaminobutyrate acetyltransferase [Acidimicrobiales bacterium]|nr:diaminobutyrate acetyltransferase [Acidimicrobiales bacterium]